MSVSTRMLPSFMITMLLVPLTACALSGGPVNGQILEAETNKPVPNAIVVARWNGTYSAIAETKTVCYHVETATTDAEGRYKIEAWSAKSKGPFFSPEAMIITAYKPGYETYTPPGYARSEAYRKNIYYLKPFTGEREERLRKTAGAAVTCGSAGESKKNLLRLYQVLYKEATPLAVTKEDKYILSNLLFRIEELELPYEEAEKRHIERHNAIYHEK